MSATTVVLALAQRTWLQTLRRPVVLTFSFVQPLVWMAFFGFLFHRYPIELDGAGLSYVTFLAPGVAAMTVVFGASQAGIALVRDYQTGFLSRMLGTPASVVPQLAGKLSADVLRLLVQSMAVLILGVAVGARLDPAVGAALIAFLGLALFAAAFAAVSCSVALVARSPEPMAVFVNVINMPLLFTSTALVPMRQMPDWLQGVVRWNPLTITVDGLRSALLFGTTPRLGALLGLAALAGAAFVVTAVLMRWAERR